jgi:orotate phosphoribosyltransferase
VDSARANELLLDSGALLKGHFLLASGLHSDTYLQCARVLQHPDRAEELARGIVEKIGGIEVDAVMTPAIGGIVLGHEVARQLGVRAIFTERKGGIMMLRRGFTVEPEERVLVVEDVVTTGGSVKEVIDIVRSQRGVVAAAVFVVDRGGGKELGAPFHCLTEMDPPTWDPEKCPLCEAGTAAVKPGGAPRKGP